MRRDDTAHGAGASGKASTRHDLRGLLRAGLGEGRSAPSAAARRAAVGWAPGHPARPLGADRRSARIPTVLMVAGDAGRRARVGVMLIRGGCRVCAVADPERAIAAAARIEADLLLVDATATGRDALTVCQRLRADARTARLPIILVTPSGRSAEAEPLPAVGVDGSLSEPFTRRALAGTVRAVLARAAR